MPTWFITGCSTGFGRRLAEAVLARGWNAVVTARDPASIQEIGAAHPGAALILPLDVKNAAQVTDAVGQAEERFGAIDVLVNNAGYGYRAAVEEGEDAAIHDMFATNFFGAVAMIKAVLPGMRARRSGMIINISSLAGRIALPGSGYYSATKFALAGVSEALRTEVEPLGIRVMVVEPSAFRTDFAGRSLKQSAVPMPDYAMTAGRRRKENSNVDGKQPGDPVRAANAIIEAATGTNPPAHLALGGDAVTRIRESLQKHLAELEAWSAVGVEADFPKPN